MQLPQQLGEIAVARLLRRGLESPAERGGNADVRGRKVYANDPAIHGAFRHVAMFSLYAHR